MQRLLKQIELLMKPFCARTWLNNRQSIKQMQKKQQKKKPKQKKMRVLLMQNIGSG